MTVPAWQRDASKSLDEIERLAHSLRALVIDSETLREIDEALSRARSQLLGSPEPVLLVAIVGATGAGKSAVINALAGARIAEVGQTRPTTSMLRVYHHERVPVGGLPTHLLDDATFVSHRQETLRHKVIIDTPDLDTFITRHRERTLRLLKAAGLVLFTFSPERYLEERVWSIIREQVEVSAAAAVLNKIDLTTDEERAQIIADLRQRFAEIGLGSIRVFPMAAEPGGERPGSAHEAPGVAALRDYLERELRDSDAARLVASQRHAAVEHLARIVARVSPMDARLELDAIRSSAMERAESGWSETLAQSDATLAGAQADARAAAAVRQHERFFGPMRAWLGLSDLLRYGVPALVGRLLSPVGDRSIARGLRALRPAVDHRLHMELARIGDELYGAGLPVTRWHEIAGAVSAAGILEAVASDLEGEFAAWLSRPSIRRALVVWLGSVLGWLIPVGLIGVGLYLLVTDLLAARYEGLALLGHLIAVAAAGFLALHVLVAIALPRPPRTGGRSGERALAAAVRMAIGTAVDHYGSELSRDAECLQQEVDALRACLAAGPA